MSRNEIAFLAGMGEGYRFKGGNTADPKSFFVPITFLAPVSCQFKPPTFLPFNQTT